jgi:hypothetical protein
VGALAQDSRLILKKEKNLAKKIYPWYGINKTKSYIGETYAKANH